MVNTIFSSRLLRAVEKSGWSIEEISGIMRVSEVVVYRILSGVEEPDPLTRQRFSVILNLPENELFP